MPLFNDYYKDAMLSDDILELIKVFADVPENHHLDTIVMPSVYLIIQQFYTAVVSRNSSEVQKMLDTGLLKAMLNIISTQCLNQGTKNA